MTGNRASITTGWVGRSPLPSIRRSEIPARETPFSPRRGPRPKRDDLSRRGRCHLYPVQCDMGPLGQGDAGTALGPYLVPNGRAPPPPNRPGLMPHYGRSPYGRAASLSVASDAEQPLPLQTNLLTSHHDLRTPIMLPNRLTHCNPRVTADYITNFGAQHNPLNPPVYVFGPITTLHLSCSHAPSFTSESLLGVPSNPAPSPYSRHEPDRKTAV